VIRELFGTTKYSKLNQSKQQKFVYQKGQKFMKLTTMTNEEQILAHGKRSKAVKAAK
jgi:hypothetical protein